MSACVLLLGILIIFTPSVEPGFTVKVPKFVIPKPKFNFKIPKFKFDFETKFKSDLSKINYDDILKSSRLPDTFSKPQWYEKSFIQQEKMMKDWREVQKLNYKIKQNYAIKELEDLLSNKKIIKELSIHKGGFNKELAIKKEKIKILEEELARKKVGSDLIGDDIDMAMKKIDSKSFDKDSPTKKDGSELDKKVTTKKDAKQNFEEFPSKKRGKPEKNEQNIDLPKTHEEIAVKTKLNENPQIKSKTKVSKIIKKEIKKQIKKTLKKCAKKLVKKIYDEFVKPNNMTTDNRTIMQKTMEMTIETCVYEQTKNETNETEDPVKLMEDMHLSIRSHKMLTKMLKKTAKKAAKEIIEEYEDHNSTVTTNTTITRNLKDNVEKSKNYTTIITTATTAKNSVKYVEEPKNNTTIITSTAKCLEMDFEESKMYPSTIVSTTRNSKDVESPKTTPNPSDLSVKEINTERYIDLGGPNSAPKLIYCENKKFTLVCLFLLLGIL